MSFCSSDIREIEKFEKSEKSSFCLLQKVILWVMAKFFVSGTRIFVCCIWFAGRREGRLNNLLNWLIIFSGCDQQIRNPNLRKEHSNRSCRSWIWDIDLGSRALHSEHIVTIKANNIHLSVCPSVWNQEFSTSERVSSEFWWGFLRMFEGKKTGVNIQKNSESERETHDFWESKSSGSYHLSRYNFCCNNTDSLSEPGAEPVPRAQNWVLELGAKPVPSQ